MSKKNLTREEDLLQLMDRLRRRVEVLERRSVKGGSHRGTVDDVASLPTGDVTVEGDTVYVTEEENTYIYIDGAWVPGSAPGTGGGGDPHWKAPVANFGALPTPDDTGDVVLTYEDGALWFYDGVDYTQITGGGGGAGHVIQDEGTPLTARAALDFVGDSVAVTDDSGGDKTVVTIEGSIEGPPGPPGEGTPGEQGPAATQFRGAVRSSLLGPFELFDNDNMVDDADPATVTFNHGGAYIVGATVQTDAYVTDEQFRAHLIHHSGGDDDSFASFEQFLTESPPVQFTIVGAVYVASGDTVTLEFSGDDPDDPPGRGINDFRLWAIGGSGSVVTTPPITDSTAQLALDPLRTNRSRILQIGDNTFGFGANPIADDATITGTYTLVDVSGDEYIHIEEADVPFRARIKRAQGAVEVDTSSPISITGFALRPEGSKRMRAWLKNEDTSDELQMEIDYTDGSAQVSRVLVNGTMHDELTEPPPGFSPFGGIDLVTGHIQVCSLIVTDLGAQFPPEDTYSFGMEISELNGDLEQGMIAQGDVLIPGYREYPDNASLYTYTGIPEAQYGGDPEPHVLFLEDAGNAGQSSIEVTSGEFVYCERDPDEILTGEVRVLLEDDYDAEVLLGIDSPSGSALTEVSVQVYKRSGSTYTYEDAVTWIPDGVDDTQSFDFGVHAEAGQRIGVRVQWLGDGTATVNLASLVLDVRPS